MKRIWLAVGTISALIVIAGILSVSLIEIITRSPIICASVIIVLCAVLIALFIILGVRASYCFWKDSRKFGLN